MSKWIKKDAYEMFAGEKAREAEQAEDTTNSFYRKWKNPVMGTVDKAKEYRIRLLPDVSNGFYKKYMYHGFTSGENFQYVLCEKTFGLDKYCPWCEANKILYQGNDTDKKKAADYKRKERFVSNILVVDDPRDAEVKDDNYKVNGTVRLYEFPSTVESKVRNEITDKDNGYGIGIFDPEEGYDLILKIKAKPKDKNGKEWPDYGDSMFARKPSAIGDNDDEIEKVMEQRIDLDEYIKSLRKSTAEQEQLLKAEMLWDDVAGSFRKHYGSSKTEEPKQSVEKKEDVPFDPPFQEEPKSVAKAPERVVESKKDDDNTDDLLAQLQQM